jgi:hypothetical protein
VLFVAIRTIGAVNIQRFAKAASAKAFGVTDIISPGFRPTDRFDEATGLPERKIDPCDPRAGAHESIFETREIRPFVQIVGA